MTQGNEPIGRAAGNLADWITAWSEEVGHVPQAPSAGTPRSTLDFIVRDAVTKAVTPLLSDPIDPNDDTLIVYSYQIETRAGATWVHLPEFSAATFRIAQTEAKCPAAVLNRVLQDRSDRGLPIPGGDHSGLNDTQLHGLDDRTCRILRLHQARLNLGLTVAQFCDALSVTDIYFQSMLRLDNDEIPLDTISRSLATARNLLERDGSSAAQKPQRA